MEAIIAAEAWGSPFGLGAFLASAGFLLACIGILSWGLAKFVKKE